MKTFGRSFWIQAAERAIKTAGQAALLAVGADAANKLPGLISHPGILFSALGGGALVSLLTSVATAGVGPKGTPSTVATSTTP